MGALAGAFSRFFTTPMNNLVTRKQTSGQTSSNGKPASSTSIIGDIYREKGITGIFIFIGVGVATDLQDFGPGIDRRFFLR